MSDRLHEPAILIYDLPVGLLLLKFGTRNFLAKSNHLIMSDISVTCLLKKAGW